jgi:hypothetical protein
MPLHKSFWEDPPAPPAKVQPTWEQIREAYADLKRLAMESGVAIVTAVQQHAAP